MLQAEKISLLVPPGLAHPLPGPLTPASAEQPAFINADINLKIPIFGLVPANIAVRGPGFKLISIGNIYYYKCLEG